MPLPHAALRGLIVTAGYRHKDLAKELGVGTAHLSHIMTGKRSPPLELAYKMLALLGESPEAIYKYFPPGGGAAQRRSRP